MNKQDVSTKPAKGQVRVTPELLMLTERLTVLDKIYSNCVRSSVGCGFRRDGQHCPECVEYFEVTAKLRKLAHTPAWTPSGLADNPTPPASLRSNKAASRAWRKSWQLACALADELERQ